MRAVQLPILLMLQLLLLLARDLGAFVVPPPRRSPAIVVVRTRSTTTATPTDARHRLGTIDPSSTGAARRSPFESFSALHFFPRRKEAEEKEAGSVSGGDDEKEKSPSTGVATTTAAASDDDKGDDGDKAASSGFSLPPFFARRFGGSGAGGGSDGDGGGGDDGGGGVETAQASSTATARVATAASAVASSPAKSSSASSPPPPSPEEEARKWRAEADRVRLEAERMDAELTLQKIEKLERQMTAGKKLKPEDLESMQNQLQALQTKLFKMDDSPPPSTNGTASASSSSTSSTRSPSSRSKTSLSSSSQGPVVEGGELASLIEQQRGDWLEDVELTTKALERAPDFIKKVLAAAAEYEYEGTNVSAINLTELTLTLDGLRVDPNKPAPVFTMQQVADREREIQADPSLESLDEVKRFLDEADLANTTRVALLTLEYDYYFGVSEDMEERILSSLADEPWLVEVLNKSAADATIESLYPKCMRNQGPEPTEAAVQQLVADLQSNGLFVATQKPDKVLGGYVVRGQSKKKTGDELVRSIDDLLERKPNLQNSLKVFYTQDFGVFLDPDAFEAYDPDDVPPILYITGPNVVRPPRPLQLSLASAAGLATCWYLAIYPFLLNPAIAKRVEEQLALADAGMTPDLNWLSQLSLPLFFTFLGLQLAGEVGHQAVAAANKVKLSVPTFVPSLITGITSTVTTFKTPPPNKAAMFDIAVAGPLLGILASLAAVAVGSSLTLTSDPSLLPALPLEILRQSTLGGGIINSILGNGALSIPEGAQGTAAVAGITIPLHPVAVAGYISLIVNALSLLPIGTTDGGRMALAVFGRGAKLLIGNIFLVALFVVGVLGSDLFLFYFGFITLFQTGNEIAAKNEVDKVEFSRVIMAIAAYVLMVLALTPFQ